MTTIWRVIHIFSGVLWMGSFAVFTLFISPSARKLGDEARPFMQALLKTRLIESLLSVGVATVVSGLFLYAGRFGEVELSTRSGLWLTVGGLAGITALLVGSTFGARSNLRMRALAAEIAGSGGPPSAGQTAEMQRLQARVVRIGTPMLVLFAIALLGMALGG
ncbi:MAG TPA: hypothetical protein VLS86_03580 [Acidimicrobiia bacterium]|nr:hypothetical protein [Acidimicrobiia bacterium]